LYFTFPRYALPSRQEALDIPIHFITATLLARLLDSLEIWARRYFSDEFRRSESKTVEMLWDVLGVDPPRSPGYATFKTVLATLSKERSKSSDRHRFANDQKRPIGYCFGPDILVRTCEVLVNNLSFLRGRPLYLFIDDYSSPKITKPLQANLNRVFMQRSAVCFFKLSTESPVSFSTDDIDGKIYVESREFVLHNLGLVYLHTEMDPKLTFIKDVFHRRLAASEATFPARELRELVGNSPHLNNNELARQIRDGKKPHLWGEETLCSLCSGDIHYLIGLVENMVRICGGPTELAKVQGDIKVSPAIQNKAIREAAGGFLKNLRSVPKFGTQLVSIVEAFGIVANSHMKFLDSKNEAGFPPKQATRIEPYEQCSLSETAQQLYDELLRYSVFIEDYRGKSRRNSIVPRLYLRRFLIPHFSLTFSTRDSIELEAREFEEFLLAPREFEKKLRLKSSSDAKRLLKKRGNAEGQQFMKWENELQ